MKKICVMGLGYIGLPTAIMFAIGGHRVYGVDSNPAVITSLQRGEPHIVEPNLFDFLSDCINAKNLTFSLTPCEADIYLIAVPTPFTEGYKPNLSYIESAVDSIAPFLRKGNLVILESTSPVGTTEMLSARLASARVDLKLPIGGENSHDVCVVHCPERVLPGNIFFELKNNHRVIGGICSCCAKTAKDLYSDTTSAVISVTDSKTAELSKLVENSFRDINIAFANELSLIADKLSIDVHALIKLANLHPRVNILTPGVGVGGHCLAVDPWFIVDSAPNLSNLIRTSRLVNLSKPKWVAEQIIVAAKKYNMRTVTCLGLSYKPDVDDFRESPAIEIIKYLIDSEIEKIVVNDPFMNQLPSVIASNKVKCMDLKHAINESSIIGLLVGHTDYSTLSKTDFQNKTLIDPSGFYELNA